MAKTGMLPHYLYSSKISEVPEITVANSADMVKSFDVEMRNGKT